MMLVQRILAVGFAIHDGAKTDERLAKVQIQKEHAIKLG